MKHYIAAFNFPFFYQISLKKKLHLLVEHDS